jgi:DnaJ-class molecular chaperone
MRTLEEAEARIRELIRERNIRRTCIKCEGHGVLRTYLDRAGMYTKAHCDACGGTGKEQEKP